MGFFSFLSRKSHDKGKGKPIIKSQSYSSTSEGVLPVQGKKMQARGSQTIRGLTQLGSYPVPGNGPDVLGSLGRPRPETSRSELSLHADDGAPAPAVPRFRDEDVERPSTAPNGTNSKPIWASIRSRKSTTRGPPPVSFRMFKASPAAQKARPVSQGTDTGSGPLPKISYAHSRTSSMRSNSEHVYKDILDAQSEIRPPDFRSRVQAAGARDYGEDVADRNIGENGFNLEAPEVQAFYAQPSNRLRAKAENDNGHSQSYLKAVSYPSGARAMSLNSSSQFPPLNKTASQPTLLRSLQPPERAPFFVTNSPSLDGKGALNTKHHQSVKTHMSPAASSHIRRATSMDRSFDFHFSGRRGDIQPIPPPEPQGFVRRPLSPRPSTAAPLLQSTALVTKQAPVRPPNFLQDSVLLAKQKEADTKASDHVIDEAKYHEPSKKERSMSIRSSAYSPRSLIFSASATFGLPRERHSLNTLQPSMSSAVASREASLDSSRQPPASTRGPLRLRTSKEDKKDEMSVGTPVSPDVIIFTEGPASSISSQEPFTSPESRETITTAATTAATTANTTTNDATNPNEAPLPPSTQKTRSIRAWSASSATATVSDTSSNPFQRPHSRHTVNTSVDLSNDHASAASLEAATTPSRTSTPPPPIKSASPIPPLPSSPKTPRSTHTNNFNIDDYLSSDDDSIAGSSHRRPRGEGEEDLLFNPSGYGADGFQLPGLFDSLTSASRQSSQQQQRVQRHRLSPSFSSPSGGRTMVYTGDSFGRAAGRRYILDTAADDEVEDEEDNDDGDEDFYSDAGGRPEEEEEEEEEDVDNNEDDNNDNDDADSMFSGRSGRSNRRKSIGIRAPPPLLLPSRVITRLSAIGAGAGDGGSPKHNTNNNKSSPLLARPRSSHLYSHHSQSYHQRYAAEPDVIEEERDLEKKVDVAAAVRLRKEIKARKRAAAKNNNNRPRNKSVCSVKSVGGLVGGGKNKQGGVKVGVHELGLGLGGGGSGGERGTVMGRGVVVVVVGGDDDDDGNTADVE